VVYNIGCICLSDDNFQRPSRRKFIFAHPVYLQAIWVKLVYEGRWVKGRVTGAKKVYNPYSCNVKLPLVITPVLQNTKPWSLHAAWGFRLWQIESCDCHLCHVTGSDHVLTKCMHLWVVGCRLEGSLVISGYNSAKNYW